MKKHLFAVIILLITLIASGQSADSLQSSQSTPDTTLQSSDTATQPHNSALKTAVKDTSRIAPDTARTAGKPKPDEKKPPLIHPLQKQQDGKAQDSTSVAFFQIHNDWLYPTQITNIDTTLRHFHYTNPLYKDERFYQSIGNPGLAHQNIYFTPTMTTGFDYGQHTFDLYRLDRNSVRFFNSLKPYTNIDYIMGPDQEQTLNVEHSQRVYKKLTLGLEINVLNSLGSYPNQESSDRRIAFTGHYVSDNSRYTAQAYYVHNKFDNEENGGIVNDSIFENNIETDRTIYTVNLEDARSLERDAEIYLRHAFELSAAHLKSDSLLDQKQKTPFNFGRLEHQMKYRRRSILYRDENYPAEYFPAIYSDSSITNDSTYIQSIENKFSWKNTRLFRTRRSLGFDFGITHRLITFADSSKKQTFNQIKLHARLSKTLFGNLKIGGELEYVQGDQNANDFRLAGTLTNRFGKNRMFQARLDQISREPSFFFSHYHSNHYRWNKTLNKENIIRINGTFRWENFEIGGNYYLLTNYTYLDRVEQQIDIPSKDTSYTAMTLQPEQRTKSFSLLQLYFYPSLRMGNFNWDSYLYFQKASNETALHIPLFAGKTSFYYRNSVFNDALQLQTGFDVKYKTDYYADKYMPALRSFYLQRDKSIGNFIYANVYASIKIKRTLILLKYRNASQGLTPYDYYDSPHHPMKDNALILAVRWRFHD